MTNAPPPSSAANKSGGGPMENTSSLIFPARIASKPRYAVEGASSPPTPPYLHPSSSISRTRLLGIQFLVPSLDSGNGHAERIPTL